MEIPYLISRTYQNLYNYDAMIVQIKMKKMYMYYTHLIFYKPTRKYST